MSQIKNIYSPYHKNEIYLTNGNYQTLLERVIYVYSNQKERISVELIDAAKKKYFKVQIEANQKQIFQNNSVVNSLGQFFEHLKDNIDNLTIAQNALIYQILSKNINQKDQIILLTPVYKEKVEINDLWRMVNRGNQQNQVNEKQLNKLKSELENKSQKLNDITLLKNKLQKQNKMHTQQKLKQNQKLQDKQKEILKLRQQFETIQQQLLRQRQKVQNQSQEILKLRQELTIKSDALKCYELEHKIKQNEKKQEMTEINDEKPDFGEVQMIQPYKMIMNVTYKRSGKGEMQACNGEKIKEQENQVLMSKESTDSEQWAWYELLDGRYALISASGRALAASKDKEFQFTNDLQTFSLWTRINLQGKSLWRSYDGKYLRVNDQGVLQRISDCADQNSIWTDTTH